MKRLCVWLIQSLAVLCVLSFSALAADAPYEGYIVKFNDEYPCLLAGESTPAGILVVDTLEEAEALPEEYVEYIEPNYLVSLFDAGDDTAAGWAPDDPYYQEYQQPLQMLDGLALYQAALTGDGVKVGFVDSGINAAHEDLNANNLFGINFHSDGLTYDQDSYGHGTFAAGILAAQTNNGIGLAGMAPDVQIMAYRAFSTKTTTLDRVANAIDQAIADGCQVINLSLGLSTDSTTLHDAVARAVDAGIIVVAAAGNTGTTVLQYPAAYDGVIGVGFVTLTDGEFVVSSFSQRNESVFVTAPGEGIAGLGYTSATSYRLDLTSASNKGTSYAAPVVTALAALALDHDADISADGMRYLLCSTAQDKGDEGYDFDYGHGVVDPAAFLTELQREFEINYELNGGQLHGCAPASYRVTDDTVMLSAFPVRDGYLFQGWYADAACMEEMTGIPAGSLGDVTVYAAWIKAPSFVGVTDQGQLQIHAEQALEETLLIRADYNTTGQLVFCSRLAITLEAGENYLPLDIIEDGCSCTFFLTDIRFRPIAVSITIDDT